MYVHSVVIGRRPDNKIILSCLVLSCLSLSLPGMCLPGKPHQSPKQNYAEDLTKQIEATSGEDHR